MVGRPQLRISLEIVAISASVWADATKVAACPCKCFDLFINCPTLKETWIGLDRESYERSSRSISSHSRLTLLPRLLSAWLMLWLGLGVGGKKSAVYFGPIIVPILTTSLFSKICNWQYCWHILLLKKFYEVNNNPKSGTQSSVFPMGCTQICLEAFPILLVIGLIWITQCEFSFGYRSLL